MAVFPCIFVVALIDLFPVLYLLRVLWGDFIEKLIIIHLFRSLRMILKTKRNNFTTIRRLRNTSINAITNIRGNYQDMSMFECGRKKNWYVLGEYNVYLPRNTKLKLNEIIFIPKHFQFRKYPPFSCVRKVIFSKSVIFGDFWSFCI